eukprot:COSAG01_NODE_1338_length_10666_cov_79.971231_3_plen_56_part_00
MCMYRCNSLYAVDMPSATRANPSTASVVGMGAFSLLASILVPVGHTGADVLTLGE